MSLQCSIPVTVGGNKPKPSCLSPLCTHISKSAGGTCLLWSGTESDEAGKQQTPVPSPAVKEGLLVWALFACLLPNGLCASVSAGCKSCLNPQAASR